MNISYLQTVYDESINTVGVSFDLQDTDIMSKIYVYKTRLDLEEGDLCPVKIGDKIKVVRVIEAHEEPEIDQDSNLEYKWITQKIDVESMSACEEEDKRAARSVRTRIRKRNREVARVELEGEFGDTFKLDTIVDMKTTGEVPKDNTCGTVDFETANFSSGGVVPNEIQPEDCK